MSMEEILNNYGFSSRFYDKSIQTTMVQLKTNINSYISLLPNDIFQIIYNQLYDIHAFTRNNKSTDILDFLKNKKYVFIKAKDISIIFTPKIDDNYDTYKDIYGYLEIDFSYSIELKMQYGYNKFCIVIYSDKINNIRLIVRTRSDIGNYGFRGDVSEMNILEIHNDIQIKNASQAKLQEIIINYCK
jgi:hypothetical protein